MVSGGMEYSVSRRSVDSSEISLDHFFISFRQRPRVGRRIRTFTRVNCDGEGG